MQILTEKYSFNKMNVNIVNKQIYLFFYICISLYII